MAGNIFRERVLLPTMEPVAQALLGSQAGPHAGAIPSDDSHSLPPEAMVESLLCLPADFCNEDHETLCRGLLQLGVRGLFAALGAARLCGWPASRRMSGPAGTLSNTQRGSGCAAPPPHSGTPAADRREECGVNGQLHAAPKRQTVANDLAASLMLMRHDHHGEGMTWI